jgi:hypothetical protein
MSCLTQDRGWHTSPVRLEKYHNSASVSGFSLWPAFWQSKLEEAIDYIW